MFVKWFASLSRGYWLFIACLVSSFCSSCSSSCLLSCRLPGTGCRQRSRQRHQWTRLSVGARLPLVREGKAARDLRTPLTAPNLLKCLSVESARSDRCLEEFRSTEVWFSWPMFSLMENTNLQCVETRWLRCRWPFLRTGEYLARQLPFHCSALTPSDPIHTGYYSAWTGLLGGSWKETGRSRHSYRHSPIWSAPRFQR